MSAIPDSGAVGALVRLLPALTGGRLVREASVVDGIQAGRIHDSGRIAFGPDRRLYFSAGDAGVGALAPDPGSLNGKMLALTPAQYRGPRACGPGGHGDRPAQHPG